MRRTHPILSALLAALPAAAFAGPLGPPAGPIAPSMKTLQQVEPRTPISAETTPGDSISVYRIAQPGSYYLTGNLAAQPGKSVILIQSGNVTLDLGGFTINAGGGVSGVSVVGNALHVTIRNGVIVGAPQWGIDAESAGETTIEKITAGDGGNGIAVYYSSKVVGCHVRQVGGVGIRTGSNSRVTGCSIEGASVNGVWVGSSSTVDSCAIRTAGGAGGPSAAAVRTSGGSIVRGCTFMQCSTAGVRGADTQILDCHIIGVSGVGIYAGERTVVRGCAITYNSSYGVYIAGHDCRVADNHLANNGSSATDAAIQVLAGYQRAHIEGNTGASNRRGIDVDGTNCLIIGNSFSGTPAGDYAYSFAAGNRFGPVVTPGTGSAVVAVGGSAPSTLGTTDPSANLCY